MASPPQEQPHLVSLVLQSKKALQHGEQLCSRAHAVSNSSAKAAVDVLALDAKVRWVTNAVNEQLKLVATVAKTIEEKRTSLEGQLQEWDTIKNQHVDSLDAVLESLGTQHVPPDFHSTGADSASSSLFGLQDLNENARENDPFSVSDQLPRDTDGHERSSSSNQISRSPSETIRPPHSPLLHSPSRSRRGSNVSANVQNLNAKHSNKMKDRSKWKTLRDFVDDAAIDQLYESIEDDRAQVEKTMSQTDRYPETLMTTVETIHSSLPNLLTTDMSLEPLTASALLSPLATSPSTFPPQPTLTSVDPSSYPPTILMLTSIINLQDNLSNEMAVQLESLTAHYGNMAQALQETEEAASNTGASPDGSGVGGRGAAMDLFSEEDLMEMNRDTEELPVILGELEDSCEAIEIQYEKLLSLHETSKRQLKLLSETITDLTSLGSIMEEMLSIQLSVSTTCSTSFSALHERLETLVHLKDRYVSYQAAFNRLILELARRRQYREAVENIVRGMINQLVDMSDEENQVRQSFNSSYGLHLPEDICLCVGNAPTRWNVVAREGDDVWEYLPEIDDALAKEARDRINMNINGSGEDARQASEDVRPYTP